MCFLLKQEGTKHKVEGAMAGNHSNGRISAKLCWRLKIDSWIDIDIMVEINVYGDEISCDVV